MHKCYICGTEKEHMFLDSPDGSKKARRICSWKCHQKFKRKLRNDERKTIYTTDEDTVVAEISKLG